MSQSPFLKVALAAVQAAEAVIKKYYQTEVQATLKEDQSPVTIADREAEEVIKNLVAESFPDHEILGEESGTRDKTAEYLWIVDPIDGTKHYTRKIPLFATQLALMHGDEIVLGVSNAPEMHELVFAEKGGGAFLNGESIKVSEQANVSSAYVSFGGIGYFDRQHQLSNLLKLEHDTQGHRGIGDFWSYHLLASGKIDIMVEAETKIWDIAALACIVQEAGGVVTKLDGTSLDRNTTSILATNGLLHQKVLSYFNQ